MVVSCSAYNRLHAKPRHNLGVFAGALCSRIFHTLCVRISSG